MPIIDFIGPSYTLRSTAVDCQSTINMFPDINEVGKGKSNLYFTGTPGLKKEFETAGTVRNMIVNNKGNLYVVEGQEFVQYTKYIENNETLYQRRVIGGVSTTSGKVGIADNGFYICIADGDSLFIYSYEEDTFTDRTPEWWFGTTEVTYFETYFVFTKPNSQQFYISPIYWGAVDSVLDEEFASKENYPDNIVTCVSLSSYLWLMGERSCQIMYNSGETFPIQKMSGGSFMVGLMAKDSVAIAAGSMFFIGRDESGVGFVYSTTGQNPTRISNFAVEYFLQNQEQIEDATAFTYQENGHYFYNINFPSAKTTWSYDLITQMWHERRYSDKSGLYSRHRAEYHVVFDKRHFVSDYEKNIIYTMSLDHLDDDGEEIIRVRRSPHLSSPELEYQYFSEFQLDMEVGDVKSDDAKVYLRYSNDGGNSWSSYVDQSLGKVGQYKKRLIWRRLGKARDRVWEISTSEKIKFTLLNAYVR